MRPISILGALAPLALAACAHTAEGPLDVPLGLPRAQVAGELRRFDYCSGADRMDDKRETYPRCDNPGLDFRDSWVTVDFDGDRVIRYQRWERWDDDQRATDRWSKLVTARAKKTPPSDAARVAVQARHDLPKGTRSWQAFQANEHTLVAVYLLEPRPPENASILEEILEEK